MFAALQDDDDDDSSTGSSAAGQQKPSEGNSVTVPFYEDLSSGRVDEETVLIAVYGDDFSSEKGVWNYPCWAVKVKPPDIDPQKIGSSLSLHLQLNKKYPYAVPKIDIQNVTGLSPVEQKELRKELHDRAIELAQSGSVMMIELVQVAEDYLLAHNSDPTMSAWEQMQEREKHQRRKENEATEVLDKLMAKDPKTSFEETSGRRQAPSEVGSQDVEKELLRQQEAIEAARRLRSTFGDGDLRRTSSGTVDSPRDDEDDFDIDLDYNAAGSSTSRYETDFIEMCVLGRGGGGEVVKARNRLDGRIYAIKKILLEREDGAMAKFGALQNQKLRREVTTVSRMTHNHVVRYYQAWVEGDGTEDETAVDPNDEFEPSTGPVEMIQEEESEEESQSSESKGFWTSTPERDTNVANSDHANEFSETKESDSGLDLFDNDFGIHDPLVSGLGFQNTLYRDLLTKQDNDSSQSDSVEETSDWDESSSVKIGTGVKGRKILYIQMEFCATTLRKLIDDGELENLNEIWRLVRQIIEAIAYIHGRKLIHRDLKPGNIFLDAEGNIRLGDFGLATKHREKGEPDSAQNDDDSEASSLYHAIEDISRLVGSSKSKKASDRREIFSPETSNANESMTGGVGTTFYRAPEQEGSHKRKKQQYTAKADIFSLGVVLFEMFHAPFSTYMERAENLTLVRGDHGTGTNYSSSLTSEEFQQLAMERFPSQFREQVPENAQRLILWCLSRDARRRPTAEELLRSELLPQKIELEQRYLSEALQLLTSPQSESYMQILDALFQKPVKDITAVTYDTDVAVKATNIRHGKHTPSESLLRAVSAIRAGAVDITSLSSLAMSDSSLIAATAALKRAGNTGKLGKGGRGMLKRATQRTAGVLAMRAATAAAVTGTVDGVHGADPEVIENICHRLQSIFESHGAVRLRSPLLRPRVETISASGGGPAELLNTRGVVLVLPEDLTVTFARAIGRGGSATSNIKRYDIDRVYHKSLAGGHPREALQASFDIVHEDHGCATEVCTEALLVASKVMEMLPCTQSSPVPTLLSKGPPWFIRINHTRLTEAILDLCLVPPEETARRAALAILGRFTAATAYTMKLFLRNQKILVDTQQSQTPSKVIKSRMEEMMSDAEKNHGLTRDALQRLRRFISCCGFLSPDASQGVEKIKEAVAQLRQHCVDSRLLKRFEDAARSLKTLRDTILSQKNFLEPFTSALQTERQQPSPLFISIDFGMRQRRKHYHGGIIFQAIVLPDNYFQVSIPDESNEFMISSAGMGVKVAEGGDFTDLVRRHRPPGNFGSAFLNRYTGSPIPFCCGIRFYIGRLVELAYVSSVYENETNHDLPGQNDVAQMRRLLGHPLSYSNSVRCIVASSHGMDPLSVPERLQVARLLWSAGISAEYLPHSGIMLSLLKRIRDDTAGDNLNASDWSLTELYGVCALLAIPFVVIVQPHLLRDKQSVRLRRINCDSSSNVASGGEIFVELDHLATTIQGELLSGQPEMGSDDSTDLTATAPAATTGSSTRSAIDCIYVDNDTYFGVDREVSKSETPHWKAYLKSIKKVELSAESFVNTFHEANRQQSVPVFAVTGTPFWALRDFGTELMRREYEQSASQAYIATADKWSKYKRELKTLAMAIETFMRRQGYWTGKGEGTPGKHSHSHHSNKGGKDHSGPLTILLYSKLDDRFDCVQAPR